MSQAVPPHAGEPAPQHRRPSPHPVPVAAQPADDGWGGGWASLPVEPSESSPPTVRIPLPTTVEPDITAAGVREPRSPDEDSSGRPLGVRFPSWDLLPPTEFVDRHRGR